MCAESTADAKNIRTTIVCEYTLNSMLVSSTAASLTLNLVGLYEKMGYSSRPELTSDNNSEFSASARSSATFFIMENTSNITFGSLSTAIENSLLRLDATNSCSFNATGTCLLRNTFFIDTPTIN